MLRSKDIIVQQHVLKIFSELEVHEASCNGRIFFTQFGRSCFTGAGQPATLRIVSMPEVNFSTSALVMAGLPCEMVLKRSSAIRRSGWSILLTYAFNSSHEILVSLFLSKCPMTPSAKLSVVPF